MDVTNQLLEGGGWEAPIDCELVVQPLLFGEGPSVVRLEKGQRAGFTVDTRPHRYGEPPPAFAALELDGAEVWRNPSRGAVTVELRLPPPKHPGVGVSGTRELAVTE